jgi:hypothetical protein
LQNPDFVSSSHLELTMSLSPRVTTGALVTLILGLTGSVAAQQAACSLRATHPSSTTFSPQAASLPVDRVNDILVLSPGVTSSNQGLLNVRNGRTDGNALYVDGTPVMPGLRFGKSPLLGGSYLAGGTPGVGIGTNGFRQLSLTAGLTPADRGNAVGGVIDVETAPCGGSSEMPAVLRAGVASDALFGASNGLGFNRFTVDGLARAGRLEFGGGAVVEGQKSVRLGREQNRSPIYVRDGVDTTVTFDVGGTDTSVAVDRFRRSDGIRIPNSATSSYTLSGQATYYLGERHRVQLSGLASQAQARDFSYEDLYNPRQTFGRRYWAQVLTGSWFGTLAERGSLRLSAEAHASLQWDHGTEAPFSDAGEKDSRDPGLGLLLSPLEFRFDQNNFGVNDQLVNNFRLNSGRLSPYDLTNTTQYQPYDLYRNNAYGVIGFTEVNGPVGTLSLYDEKRTVGSAAATAEIGALHRIRAGFEATRYDIHYYTSGLTSQAFAEAYVEEPTSMAAFGEYQLRLTDVTVTGGLRYDRFKSGASRPDFPRISSMPGFDPSDPTAQFTEDKAHSRVSPRIGFVAQGTPRMRLFGGYTALAQIPDFSLVFAGINTDLSTTSNNHVFGTDLDFQRSGLFEGGFEYLLDSSTTFGGTLWSRSDKDRIAGRLSSEVDPFRGSNVDIRRVVNAVDASTTGFDARITRTLGAGGQVWVNYGFMSPEREVKAETRKHNLSAAVLYETGSDYGALGGLLRNSGVYATFRYASGTPYTACPAANPDDVSVLSDGICSREIEGSFYGERLSSLKMLDLRVSRGVEVGRAQLVLFADARNLFNFTTVTRVFAQTGDIVNDRERDINRAIDLTSFANEGDANGVLDGSNALDLSFGGAADPRAACGNWTNASGVDAAPNCVYLINAEERFGNGDHIFTTAEQTRASDAYYYVSRGAQNFTAPGRRVRIGLEVRF